MKSRLIFLDRSVTILANGEALGTQLVTPPGVGERLLELRIGLRAQGLVGPLQPIAGLGICTIIAMHLRERFCRAFILLRYKIGFPEKEVGRVGHGLCSL